MPEPQKDSWLKLVALTIIILSVAASIAAFKSVGYATKTQVYAAQEARQWQDYQVESIKKDNYGMSRDILASFKASEGKPARVPKIMTTKIKEYEDEMTRLNQEKDQIKKIAQSLAAQQTILQKKANESSLAVILMQLAIVSSAVALLVRKKILWIIGLVLGAWGMVSLGTSLFF